METPDSRAVAIIGVGADGRMNLRLERYRTAALPEGLPDSASKVLGALAG